MVSLAGNDRTSGSGRIVTLTLNPVIDVSSQAETVRHTHKVRTSAEQMEPGGGGINVSRVLNRLGADVRAIFLGGGVTGQVLDEALEEALALDPDSWEANREAARIFYFQRRFDEAARCYEKAVCLDETDYHSWGMLSSVYEALGDKEGVTRAARMSVTNAERVLAENPTNGAALSMGATGLAMLGEKDRFKEWIERAMLVDPDNLHVMQYNFACATALRLNDPEAAIDLLEPVFPKMNLSLFRAALADPDLESLRKAPRFKKMVDDARQRLGLSSQYR